MIQAVILAAGMGTRLGRPHPKSLTPLADGRSILAQQVENLESVFGDRLRLTIVVGFKLEAILEAEPDATFVYNENFDTTNTSKSLLKALRASHDGGVLWLNGDVVFDAAILTQVLPVMAQNRSFVVVDTSAVGEEEVKYTLNADGNIAELSKTVQGALGEAVGINYVAERDKARLIHCLEHCAEDDYFERGIELAIGEGAVFSPVPIGDRYAVEVDFAEDLERVNHMINEMD